MVLLLMVAVKKKKQTQEVGIHVQRNFISKPKTSQQASFKTCKGMKFQNQRMIQRVVRHQSKGPKAKGLKTTKINKAQKLHKENVGKILQGIYILRVQDRLQSQNDLLIVYTAITNELN